LNRDENILYLNVTRANAVWRLPLLASGEVTKAGMFLQLSGGLGGPDGLAIDENGGLAVAHAGLGTVWLFNRIGEPIYRVKSCAGLGTTNIAYGGPDRKTLYITESETGCILKAQMPFAGNVMYSHM
jgi:gluconolactonase